MKHFYLLAVALLCASLACGEPVSQQQALRIAQKFFTSQGITMTQSAYRNTNGQQGIIRKTKCSPNTKQNVSLRKTKCSFSDNLFHPQNSAKLFF